MLVVANHLAVADGRDEEFIDLFETRLEDIRGRPGLEQVEILRAVEEDRFVIRAYWDSQAAFDRWRDSEAFREAHADIPEAMFDEPNRLELYEPVLSMGGGDGNGATGD